MSEARDVIAVKLGDFDDWMSRQESYNAGAESILAALAADGYVLCRERAGYVAECWGTLVIRTDRENLSDVWRPVYIEEKS